MERERGNRSGDRRPAGEQRYALALAAFILLGASACGPPLTGLDGFWRTPYDSSQRHLWLAIGHMGTRRVWAVSFYPFVFADAESGANCRFHWEQHGTDVLYVGTVDDLDNHRYEDDATVTTSGSTAALTWKMSALFEDFAATHYLRKHPTADPNLATATSFHVNVALQDARTLELHGYVHAADVSTGDTLADEALSVTLERQDQCYFGTDF